MRKKIIAANWKMNYTVNQAEDFITKIKDRINTDEVDVVVCPNFVSIDRVSNILDGTNIKTGAQNVYFEPKGAYTGETSVDMLIGANVKYCIVGHSERRSLFNETNEIVNKKVHALLEKDLNPIVCVGETLEQRNSSKMFEVVGNQIKESLKDVSKEQIQRNIVIAYEPIWAIGTGVTATSSQAQEMCKFIRSCISAMFDEKTSQIVRIQYGGSVKPTNVKEILEMPDIDGALVGGASLTEDFVAIVNY